MAPEIWVGEKLIASVPDKTGMHKTLSGKPLYVNVDKIDSMDPSRSRIELEAEEIGGKRGLYLDWDGTGKAKGFEKKSKPPIRVVLLEKPICEMAPVWELPRSDLDAFGVPVYSDADIKLRRPNPYWVKKRG